MVAETLTGTRAATNFPAQGYGHTGALYQCWGQYAVAANVEDGDIFEMCRTPDAGSGFLVLGGDWYLDVLDSNATETLDLDLGWAANGTSSAATITLNSTDEFTDSGNAASVAGLVNGGVLTGNAVTDVLPATINWRPIILPTPLWFAKPTKIQVEANAAAATFAAGNMSVVLRGVIL